MEVRFLFDFGSPNAFLCHRVLPQIEKRTGARFDYVPVLLGGLFKMTGNQSPVDAFATVRNKPEYQQLEMERFLRKHGISDYVSNTFFPVNTLQLMRGAVASQELGVFEAYVDWIYDDMWVRNRKMDDPEIFAASLSEAGLPRDEILSLSKTDAVKAKLMANTQAAVDAGVFGSPSFFVGQELYFGKDRLCEVEEEIIHAGAAELGG